MSGNPNIPWTPDLIEAHEPEWNWGIRRGFSNTSFSCNEKLPWSPDFIDRYQNLFEWGSMEHTGPGCWDLFSGISGNTGIQWSIDYLCKYADKLYPRFVAENYSIYKTIEDFIGKENVFQLYKTIA